MTTRKHCSNPLVSKVQRLGRLVEQLRKGEHFNITRLTVLKSFCKDPVVTIKFGLFLVEMTKPKAPKRYQPLIDSAVREIKKHLHRPSDEPRQSLWIALEALEQSQNKVEHHRWTDVRIIHSKGALLAEHTLRCIVRPWTSAHWGYHLGAIYAERYDPRYGTGLIPASAAPVQDIFKFWSRYSREMNRNRSRPIQQAP